MDLGLKIRTIRQEKRIKQGELASFLKISQGSLSKIESGATYITVEQLINISHYTKKPLTDFFPEDMFKFKQMDHQLTSEELHVQKEMNLQLLKRIKNLEKQLELQNQELEKYRNCLKIKC